MTGSLQIKNKKYYAVLNFKDLTGKRVVKWVSLHLDEKGNKKRATAMLNQLLIEYADKEVIKTAPLFTDYISEWLDLEKGRIELSTWESYESYSRTHIIPYFKRLNLTVDKITPAHIKAFYDEKSRRGRLDKKAGGLSHASLKNFSKVIKQVLDSAVLEGYASVNVSLRVPIPHRVDEELDKEPVFLNVEEANNLLAAFQGHRLQPLIYVALYYGLRRSELVGLKWDAIDFESNTIKIQHVVVKTKTIEAKDRTKSKSSKRAFELLPDVREMLLNLKKEQDANRKLFKSSYIESGYVFTWDNGEPYRPDFVTRAFKAQLKKCGLPDMRLHDLRHSTASILYDKGWSLKDIQLFMGHADIETTGNVYTHIKNSRQKMMTAQLANTFSL